MEARINRPFVKQDTSIKETQALLDKLLGSEDILSLKINELNAEIERLKKEIVDIAHDETLTLLDPPIPFKTQQKMSYLAVDKEDEEAEKNYHIEVKRELQEREAATALYMKEKAEYDKILAERDAHNNLHPFQRFLSASPPDLPPMPVPREDKPFPPYPKAIDPNVPSSHKFNSRYTRAMEDGRIKQFRVEYKLSSGKAIKHFEVETDHCDFYYGKWEDGKFTQLEKDSAEYREMLEQGVIHLSFSGQYKQEKFLDKQGEVLYKLPQGDIGITLRVYGPSRDSQLAINKLKLKKDHLELCEERLMYVSYVLRLIIKGDIASYNDKISLLEGEEGAVNHEKEKLKHELNELERKIKEEKAHVDYFRQENADDGVKVLNLESVLSQKTYVNLYALLQTLQLPGDALRKYLDDSRFTYENRKNNNQDGNEQNSNEKNYSQSHSNATSHNSKRFFHSEKGLHYIATQNPFYALNKSVISNSRKTMKPQTGFSGVSFYVPKRNISTAVGENATNKLLTTAIKTVPSMLRRVIR